MSWTEESEDRLSILFNYYKRHEVDKCKESLNGAEVDGLVLIVQTSQIDHTPN